MAVFCGIDWAEGHHDIALVDGEGRLLAKRRIDETPDGFTELPAMLPRPETGQTGSPSRSRHREVRWSPRCVAPAGRNTRSTRWRVARYRERGAVSGKKSDQLDALTLALLTVLNATCDAVERLAGSLIDAFRQQPDYQITTSFRVMVAGH